MYAYKSQIRSGGGNHYCGTTSLDGNSLIEMVRDVLKEFARHGARKIAVIDGHYENEFFLTEACDLAIRDLRYDGIDDVKILKMRYCEEITGKALDTALSQWLSGPVARARSGVRDLDDAPSVPASGRCEQDLGRSPPADFPALTTSTPGTPTGVPPSGCLSPAHGSSAEIGKMLVEEFTNLVSSALEARIPEHGW